MCMGGAPSMPAAQTPAAAPAPAPDPATAPVINDAASSGKNLMAANSAGAGGFKVDRAGPTVSGGSGLNIPTAG